MNATSGTGRRALRRLGRILGGAVTATLIVLLYVTVFSRGGFFR